MYKDFPLGESKGSPSKTSTGNCTKIFLQIGWELGTVGYGKRDKIKIESRHQRTLQNFSQLFFVISYIGSFPSKLNTNTTAYMYPLR